MKVFNITGKLKDAVHLDIDTSKSYTVIIENENREIFAKENISFASTLKCLFLTNYQVRLLSLGEFMNKINL
jgi:hypothetical protein